MSSATSTDATAAGDAGFRVWHFYLLLSMCGATAAVVLSPNTNPVALLLMSAAVLAAGAASYALHTSLAGFWSGGIADAPVAASDVPILEREKALILRSIKELEFDHAMKKVGEADFAEMSGRLRARALSIMQDLARVPEPVNDIDRPATAVPLVPATAVVTMTACPSCDTPHDVDARFCKQCGARLTHV